MWPFVIRIKCIETISIWTRVENGLARTGEYKMTPLISKPTEHTTKVLRLMCQNVSIHIHFEISGNTWLYRPHGGIDQYSFLFM